MKKYRVNVNNNLYEIDIEELLEKPSTVETTKPEKVVMQTEGENIVSPMPGTILNIHINVGDQIKKGQVLMILEALKMENEIMAPRDGKVTSIHVAKGTSVESGTLLCVIA